VESRVGCQEGVPTAQVRTLDVLKDGVRGAGSAVLSLELWLILKLISPRMIIPVLQDLSRLAYTTPKPACIPGNFWMLKTGCPPLLTLYLIVTQLSHCSLFIFLIALVTITSSVAFRFISCLGLFSLLKAKWVYSGAEFIPLGMKDVVIWRHRAIFQLVQAPH
jgi:hypothetical protein